MADLATTPTTFIPKAVYQAQLPLSSSAHVLMAAVAAGHAFKLTMIVLVNDTTTSTTATIHICPNGDAHGDANILLKGVVVPPGGIPLVFDFGSGLYLNATDTIEGYSLVADQITCYICGVEEY